mmetsp:Transcript_68871/g.121719  ORF Transcript_68871/g.121719 Transcript_68871/m.121719 type:complete len:150 (+) Transcript_68871:831-1280(+)
MLGMHGFSVEDMEFKGFKKRSFYSLLAGNCMSVPVIGSCIFAIIVAGSHGSSRRHWKLVSAVDLFGNVSQSNPGSLDFALPCGGASEDEDEEDRASSVASGASNASRASSAHSAGAMSIASSNAQKPALGATKKMAVPKGNIKGYFKPA